MLFGAGCAIVLMVAPCGGAEPLPGGSDASTLAGKVMCGYQGWFRCPGDAAGLGWVHWSSDRRRISPNTLTVDLWPDTSEYSAAERFAAPGFSYSDGSPAYLFSSDNAATVLRHFQWMREYGIDGAWLQRFLVGLPGGRGAKIHYPSTRRVMDHCLAAADKTGRVWAISYDIAAMPTDDIFDALTGDWKRMIDEGVVGGPRYLHHAGLPVVQIWGFYHNASSNLMTAELAHKLIDYFAAPGPQRAFLVGGGGWNWRRDPDPQWQQFYQRFQAYAPWNVGSLRRDKQKGLMAQTATWPDDLRDCRQRGALWIPVLYPGFSWNNLMHLRKVENVTTVPRRDGQFLWEQFYALAQLKVDCAYLAMFDEVDEGTALFKLSASSWVKDFAIQRDRLPSDWWLRVVREGIKMLRGQRPLVAEIPIRP